MQNVITGMLDDDDFSTANFRCSAAIFWVDVETTGEGRVEQAEIPPTLSAKGAASGGSISQSQSGAPHLG